MVNVAAADIASLVRRVQTVALGQKIFQRPGSALERIPRGMVPDRELRRRCAPVRADTSVANLFVADGLVGHLCVEVGQVEGGAGSRTAMGLCASRLKNQMPGLPSALT